MSHKPLPCHHAYDPRTCLVCKAEAVAAHFNIQTATGARLDELMKVPLRPYGMTDEQVREKYYGIHGHKPPNPRALAIVALRRIVDRAVSDEVSSLATTDILRIALKALNQLED